MKIFSLLIILLISRLVYSQDTLKYNTSNSITGSYTSNTKQINFSYSGTNNFIYGKYGFYNTSNVSESWVSKKIAEEISHKFNLTRDKLFVLYVFTRSLTRGIVYDNSIGFGYVHWWKYFSLSYGILNEVTVYDKIPNTNVYRHSIRAKFNSKNITIECYYQPNIVSMDNVIFTSTSKITLLQKNNFSLTFNDNVNYRSMSSTKMIHSANINLTYNLKK